MYLLSSTISKRLCQSSGDSEVNTMTCIYTTKAKNLTNYHWSLKD